MIVGPDANVATGQLQRAKQDKSWLMYSSIGCDGRPFSNMARSSKFKCGQVIRGVKEVPKCEP
jgi:hypothetical protein